MFRATSQIFNLRTLLYYHNSSRVQVAFIYGSTQRLKYKKATERETCPPPALPPPPPPPDYRLIGGALALVFLSGAFAVYAKTNPEIRDWLTIRAPWFDDLIAVLYEENMTHKQQAEKFTTDLKEYIEESYKENPKKCTDGKRGPVKSVKAADVPKEVCKVDDASPCDKLPAPRFTNVCDVEKCLIDVGDVTVNNYMTARDACIYYNKLVAETMVKFTSNSIKELQNAMNERIELVNTSEEGAAEAISKLDELARYFECVHAPKEKTEYTKAMFQEYRNKIKEIELDYKRELEMSLVRDRQWQMVATEITKYMDENQALFAGLKYDQDKLNFQGDPDILLYHTYRYMQKFQKDLCAAQAGMLERVDRALEILPQDENSVKARNAEIAASIKKKEAAIVAEHQKWFSEQQVENNNMLRDALKMQLDRHEAQMKIKLKQKEDEATEKLNKLVAEKVASEKQILTNQTEDMAKKLKVVEDKLEEALKAERDGRKSQELWTAGSSLLEKTKGGQPFVKIDKELKAIEKVAGDEDKLVLSVLKSIPKSVKEQGVVPESVLKKNYRIVEKVAMQVALVEQEGASLPVYVLSYIQSLFLFMKLYTIPQAEIDSPLQEPFNDLDTFDLLQRARYYMERGNIAQALRYVNSLQGASLGAYASWRDAARAYLETRQAAEALLAHAAALSLHYI